MSKLAWTLPNRRRVPQSESPKSDSLLDICIDLPNLEDVGYAKRGWKTQRRAIIEEGKS